MSLVVKKGSKILFNDRRGYAASGICNGEEDSSLSRCPVGSLPGAQQQTAPGGVHGVDARCSPGC